MAGSRILQVSGSYTYRSSVPSSYLHYCTKPGVSLTAIYQLCKIRPQSIKQSYYRLIPRCPCCLAPFPACGRVRDGAKREFPLEIHGVHACQRDLPSDAQRMAASPPDRLAESAVSQGRSPQDLSSPQCWHISHCLYCTLILM